jgi:hypothetical protein
MTCLRERECGQKTGLSSVMKSIWDQRHPLHPPATSRYTSRPRDSEHTTTWELETTSKWVLYLSPANKGPGKKANTKAKSNSNAVGNSGKGREAKPDWMTKKPKDGEPNKKVVNEKDYWWCPKHETWTRHTPEQCKGKGVKPSGKKTKGKSGNNKVSENGEQVLRLSQAFATIADSSQE